MLGAAKFWSGRWESNKYDRPKQGVTARFPVQLESNGVNSSSCSFEDRGGGIELLKQISKSHVLMVLCRHLKGLGLNGANFHGLDKAC